MTHMRKIHYSWRGRVGDSDSKATPIRTDGNKPHFSCRFIWMARTSDCLECICISSAFKRKWSNKHRIWAILFRSFQVWQNPLLVNSMCCCLSHFRQHNHRFDSTGLLADCQSNYWSWRDVFWWMTNQIPTHFYCLDWCLLACCTLP